MCVTAGTVVGQAGTGHGVVPCLERGDILQALRYAAWRAGEREVMWPTHVSIRARTRRAKQPGSAYAFPLFDYPRKGEVSNRSLFSMNLSPRWAAMQAEAGIGAAHRPTPGTHNAPDPVIMAYASANDYAALTHDLGFGAILAATQGEKPGVVQIRAGGVSSDVIGSQVIVALRQMASERGEGALPTVDPGRTRLRVPPLPPRG